MGVKNNKNNAYLKRNNINKIYYKGRFVRRYFLIVFDRM